MDYIFKGNFSYKNHLIPFQLQDGHVRLNVSNLSRNEICHIDNNGVEWFGTNSPFKVEYLEGLLEKNNK